MSEYFFDNSKVYDFEDMVSKGIASRLKGNKKLLGDPNLEKVKTISKVACNFEDLDNSVFGLVVKQAGDIYRKFPLNDTMNTWLSQIAYVNNNSNIPISCRADVAFCIKKACDYYGLVPHLMVEKAASYSTRRTNFINFDSKEVKDRESEILSKVSKQSEFAFPEERLYPLNSQLQITEAKNFFANNLSELKKLGKCSEFASNLKKQMEKFSMDVPEFVVAEIDDYDPVNKEVVKIAMEERILFAKKNLPSKNIENIKHAAESIINSSQFLNPLQLKKKIIEFDAKMLNVNRPQAFCSAESIIKNAQDILSEKVNIASPAIHSMTNFSHAVDAPKDWPSIEKKLSENPNVLKGFFSQEMVDKITISPKTEYDKMLFEDKKMFDEAIGLLE